MSNTSSSIISQLYKTRETILTHLDNQGYNVDEYTNFSINEVNALHQNSQLDMLLEKKPNDSNKTNKVYVKYYLGKILQHNIQEIVDDLYGIEDLLVKGNDDLIIITKDELNDKNLQKLKYIWSKENIFVTVFSIKHLQFNVLKHVMVPQHRVLSRFETDHVKKQYNIDSDDKFPEISRFDPVAKAIGIKPGQVCEIIRPSKSSINSYYYRICV